MIIDFSYSYPKLLQPMFKTNRRYILLKGGRSSGKTETVAHYLLDLLMGESKTDLLCCREFQKSIDQSNYKVFKRLIEKYKLPFQIYANQIVNKYNKSTIVFSGLSDLTADGIKSYDSFKYCWIEEAQRISQKSWEILDPTIRAEGSQIFITMNPEVPDSEHPITSELTTIKNNDSLIIHINYNDNPFCPPDMVHLAELYKQNKPDEYKRIWLGIPDDNFNSKVVKGFTQDNIKPLHYLPDIDLHLSCDFNVDPMMWVVAYRTIDKVFFIDELVLENTTSKQAIQAFIERYKGHKGNIIINGDASGDYRRPENEYTNYIIIRNELQKAFSKKIKVDIRYFNPPIINRINAFNELIHDIHGKRRLFVSPRCKWLLYNIQQLKYKEGTSIINTPTHTQIRQDKKLKFLGHIFDAASYLVDFYFPIKNEQGADTN